MAVEVLEGEISIDGILYPIQGGVRLAGMGTLPSPITLGDLSKRGESPGMSSISQSDPTGGAGIFIAPTGSPDNRFWYSDLDTRFRNQITLTPGRVDLPTTDGPTGIISLAFPYKGKLYFAQGLRLYEFDPSAGTWNSGNPVKTFVGDQITDWTRAFGAIFVSVGSSGWYTTDGSVWTQESVAVDYLTFHDGAVWGIDNADEPVLRRRDTSATVAGSPQSWTDKAKLPSGVIPRSLFVYRDAEDNPVIYCGTDEGLYVYDAVGDQWLATDIRWQFGKTVLSANQFAGTSPVVWRDGSLYIIAGGASIFKITAGPTFTVEDIGPGTDDGVGRNFGLIPYLPAGLVDGGPWLIVKLEAALGNGMIQCYDGKGWHTINSAKDSARLGFLLLSDEDISELRLYYTTNTSGAVSYLVWTLVPPNPLRAISPTYYGTATYTDHVTSWFDLGRTLLRKVLGHLYLSTTVAAGWGEKITPAYATTLVAPTIGETETWNPLPDITTTGFQDITIESTGVAFRYIRFRFRFTGAANKAAVTTPILHFWSAEFLTRFNPQYVYNVVIDLTRPHHDQDPLALRTNLLNLVKPDTTQTFVEFTWQDRAAGALVSEYGYVRNFQASNLAGRRQRGEGKWLLTFVVPYPGDAT